MNAFGNGRKKDDNSSRPKPAAFRFQDATNRAMEDRRRTQIKDKLIDSVKGDELEEYRKSEDEVRRHLVMAFTTVH